MFKVNAAKVCAFVALAVIFCQSTVHGEDCIDVKAHAEEVKECCNIPNPIDMTNIEECTEKFMDLKEDATSFIACVYECHATNLGLLDGTTINKDKLMDMVNGISDEEMKQVVTAVVESCLEAVPDIAKAVVGHDLKCSPFAFAIDECVMRGIYGHCPDSHWADTEICAKIKNGAKECE